MSDIDRPQPGDRLLHTHNGSVGTVLSHRFVEWPAHLDRSEWTYVRFDSGIQNYFPNIHLAPERGCRDFAGRPDVGV